jgi:hypothetical protein
MVVILDDQDRENEGDLIMAAQYATPEAVAFMIRHTSGIICVPMDPEQLARLELPQMVPNNDEAYRTAFTVSVDYRFGTTTGVSSSDRAATIRALVDPASVRTGLCATRTYLSAATATRRCPDQSRPYRGCRRSLLAGGSATGRRAVRAHERRRQHGAPRAAGGFCP